MKEDQSFYRPKKKFAYRLLEILPGFLSWLVLLGTIILSFFEPIWVAVFIICFDVYWLIKVIYLAVYLLFSYGRLKRNEKIAWLEKCKSLRVIDRPKFEEIYHLIIIPMVDEEVNIVKQTFQALINSNYPKDKMIVVLATEERVGDCADQIVKEILAEFSGQFYYLQVTKHPDNIIGEIKGKGSNETWAARQIKKFIDERGLSYESIITSVLDVDTCVHSEYFGILTYKFLTVPDHLHASYQPVPMFFNNLWDSPALMRIVAMSTTFWMLMEQGRPEKLYTFSSHSMSFKTLVEVGFWETDVVSEDSRIFWQCFMKYNGEYRCEPLLIPVYMDTVLANSFWQSVTNQYKQQRRWAYGAENIPYVLSKFAQNKKIPLLKKMGHGFWVVEGMLSWATNSILIFVAGWLPLLVGGEAFSKSLLAQNLPYITQVLMTLAMLGMVVSATLSMLMLPPRPKRHKQHKILFMLLQWILLPISTIFLGAVPALDAQTRLMFGKYMGFWVTEKKRHKIKYGLKN